ncbi:MAG: response regulator [Myxococcales bacterium]|nr:response regulator [Myxococcales bacterium]
MPKQILLADDSATIAKIVEITFAHEDFVVTAVRSGDEAIAHARAHPPDLVLLDAQMPGKSGYEACTEIRASGLTAPVLILTGNFSPYDEARGKIAGADGNVVKPFETQALIDRVSQLVGLRKGEAATPASVAAAPPAAPLPNRLPPVEPLRPPPLPEAPKPGVPPVAAQRPGGRPPAPQRSTLMGLPTFNSPTGAPATPATAGTAAKQPVPHPTFLGQTRPEPQAPESRTVVDMDAPLVPPVAAAPAAPASVDKPPPMVFEKPVAPLVEFAPAIEKAAPAPAVAKAAPPAVQRPAAPALIETPSAPPPPEKAAVVAAPLPVVAPKESPAPAFVTTLMTEAPVLPPAVTAPVEPARPAHPPAPLPAPAIARPAAVAHPVAAPAVTAVTDVVTAKVLPPPGLPHLAAIHADAPKMPRPSLIPNAPVPHAKRQSAPVMAVAPSPTPTPVPPSIPAPAPLVAAVTEAVAREAAPRVAEAVAGATARGPEYDAIVKLSREVIEQIAWEIIPDLAETIIRAELDRLVKDRALAK